MNRMQVKMQLDWHNRKLSLRHNVKYAKLHCKLQTKINLDCCQFELNNRF